MYDLTRFGLTYNYSINNVVKNISSGKIQVPEFMSDQFYWGEQEIINLLDYFYSGLYKTNVLVINSGLRFDQPGEPVIDLVIPSRRLSHDISDKRIKFPNYKLLRASAQIHYIIDGYHRLQSLYLAWYGLYNRKHVYFYTGALNETRFSFLKPTDCRPIHKRLNNVKGIRGANLPFVDQLNYNCQRFEETFFNSGRISFDIINLNDPLLDEILLITADKNPEFKIVADRIKYIRDNYIS